MMTRPPVLGLAVLLSGFALQAAQATNLGTLNVSVSIQDGVTLTRTKNFDAGKFGLIALASPVAGGVHVTTSGTATYDSSSGGTDYAIKVSAPTVGTFTIAGAAPSSPMNVSYEDQYSVTVVPGVTVEDMTCTSAACLSNGGAQGVLKYTLADDTASGVVTTDGSGNATFHMAGDIVTDGTSTKWGDGAYVSPTITVNVDY